MEWIFLWNKEEQDKSLMDLKVSGTKDAILMVEAGANRIGASCGVEIVKGQK